jgi:hypothetical protein
MLYDPKWSKPEVKTDPFKLETLIAWLEKQRASEPYCFLSNGECLLAHYLTGRGYRNVNAGGYDFAHADSTERVDFPYAFRIVAKGHPRTFGAALERARSLVHD